MILPTNWLVAFRSPEAPGFLDRVIRLRPWIPCTLATMLFILLSLASMIGESVTSDESVHLPAGYSYLTTLDFRLNPEHPPLVKLLSALPWLAIRPRISEDGENWRLARQWTYGYKVLYQSGNDPDQLLFWGRLPNLVWGILLLNAVYIVARRRFGPGGALVSLATMALSPTLLAHSHLVTTDAAAACLAFLSVLSFEAILERPTLLRASLSGFVLGACLSAKYSGVLVLPCLAVVGLVRWLRRGGEATVPRARIIGCVLACGATALGVIWATYGFCFRVSADDTYGLPWEEFDREGGFVLSAIRWVREWRLIPEPYLFGFAHVHVHSIRGHNAYALGQYSTSGWWWYFPFALLVKTPAAAVVLYLLGLCWAVHRLRKDPTGADLLFVTPIVVFMAAAMYGKINIGVRHVLPVEPFMAVLAGGILAPAVPGGVPVWGRRLAFVAVLAVGAECLSEAPYFLQFFNTPARAFRERHELLVDSNLDWGQDLGRLKKWMDRRGISRIKLAYCGAASPRQLGLSHEVLPAGNMYSDLEKEWKRASDFRPGDLVAISATCYVGVTAEDRQFYLRRFGSLKPIAEIGHSFLVFKIPDFAADK